MSQKLPRKRIKSWKVGETHGRPCTSTGKFLTPVHGHAWAAHPAMHSTGFNLWFAQPCLHARLVMEVPFSSFVKLTRPNGPRTLFLPEILLLAHFCSNQCRNSLNWDQKTYKKQNWSKKIIMSKYEQLLLNLPLILGNKWRKLAELKGQIVKIEVYQLRHAYVMLVLKQD